MEDSRPERPGPPVHLRGIAASLLLLVALGSTSCITTYLWGGTIGPDADGDGAAEVHPDVRVHGWDDFLIKVALTPFTVVLDICTFPVQAAVFGWEKAHRPGDADRAH